MQSRKKSKESVNTVNEKSEKDKRREQKTEMDTARLRAKSTCFSLLECDTKTQRDAVLLFHCVFPDMDNVPPQFE